jgi:hypothetical protein
VKNETVCGCIATVSTRILGHGEAWVNEIFDRRCLEDPKMRYSLLDDLELWCSLDGSEEDFAVRLLYEKFLTVKGVPWRSKKGDVSRLQCSGQDNKIS